MIPVLITLAPKKLILTRRASEGSASEPSLARRVSMCKDAKLSCRGNMPAVPPTFNQRCRDRGRQWLDSHPPNGSERLPNYWREFIPDLCRGFGFRCGYLAMLDLNGTVDHFLSTKKKKNRHLAYEWSNYRYATGWLNSSKQTLDEKVLDPLAVREVV